MHTILKSNTREVVIGADKPFVIIGEKINPTGIKKLGQALVEQNFEYVQQLARRQVAWGADVLDVNVGHPQIDEEAIMPKVVEAICAVVDVPLCINFERAEDPGGRLEKGPGQAAGQFGQWRGEAALKHPAHRQGSRRGRHRPDDRRGGHSRHSRGTSRGSGDHHRARRKDRDSRSRTSSSIRWS